MLENLIGNTTSWIIGVIEQGGYGGIFFLMTLEGSFIPVPSEIILPFSGYLVTQGTFSLFAIGLVGALANVAGTLITYAVGRYFGRPFFYKYGKYVLIARSDIDRADSLFSRYGISIIFLSRLVPGARGYIPIGAGLAKMKIAPFVATVFLGSFFYTLVLTYTGVVLGEHWGVIGPYVHRWSGFLVLLVFAGIGWLIWRKIQDIRKESYEQNIHHS